MYNLSLNYLQNEEDARDATQEVFVKIHQQLGKYDAQKATLKTWIYRITINHNLDILKARRVRRRWGLVTGLFQADTEVAHFEHPGVLLEHKKELEQLFQWMNRLPDRQKTALILARLEERPQAEIAEIMGLGIKAVESLLQRAKNNLSKMMQQNEGSI